MDDFPRISESEWLVMKVVWAKAPVTTKDVLEAVAPETNWKLKTVLTFLTRLVEKGALRAEKSGRSNLYFPLIEESECVLSATKSFFQRVYDGALKPMMANFIQEADLSDEDAEELIRLLERKRNDS